MGNKFACGQSTDELEVKNDSRKSRKLKKVFEETQLKDNYRKESTRSKQDDRVKKRKNQKRESSETTKQEEEELLGQLSTDKNNDVTDSKTFHEKKEPRKNEQKSGKEPLDLQATATVSDRKKRMLEKNKEEEKNKKETKYQHEAIGKESGNSIEKENDQVICEAGRLQRQATTQKNNFQKQTENLEHDIETLRQEKDDTGLQYERDKNVVERAMAEEMKKKKEGTTDTQQELNKGKRRTTTFPAVGAEIEFGTDYIDIPQDQETQKQLTKDENGISTEVHLKGTELVNLTSYEKDSDASVGKESVNSFAKQNDDLKYEIGSLQKRVTDQKKDFQKKTEKLEHHIEGLRKEKHTADLQYERDKEVSQKDLEKAQTELIKRNEIILQLETSLQKEKDEKSKQLSILSDICNFPKVYEIGDSLRSENNAINEDLFEQVKKGVQRLVDEIKSLKEDKIAQMYENKNLEKQVANLKEENIKLDTIVASLKEENISLQDSLKTLKQESGASDTEKSEKLDEQSERIIELEKALALKDQEYRNALVENDSMKAELEIIKSKKIMHVQLYHFNRVSLVSELEEELRALLKSKLEDAKTELDFTECNEAGDVNKNLPLLIVCISASRLGTDVKNAIQSLKLTPNMALIIFHHKDLHALPNQASERVLTGDVFSRVGGVYDFAFLSGKGIYDCDMNQRNIQRLVIFLKREEL